jgi:hypothetical protein
MSHLSVFEVVFWFDFMSFYFDPTTFSILYLFLLFLVSYLMSVLDLTCIGRGQNEWEGKEKIRPA